MNSRRIFPLLSILSLLSLLAACAGVPLPEEALSRVDPSVEFAEVKGNPEAFGGRTLLLGGQILENRATPQGSVLEMLHHHLNRYGRPTEIDEYGGRFLVRSDRFLDPEVYEKGKYLTLTGTVIGRESRPLKDIEYTYPVFRLESAHLWREPFAGYGPYYGPPHYYGPSYYPYPYYDPFWSPWYRDPFWYHRRPWLW